MSEKRGFKIKSDNKSQKGFPGDTSGKDPVTLLSFCCQSFPASGSFPMSQIFVLSGQNIEASSSATILPMHIKGWFPLGLTVFIYLQSKGLSRVFSSTIIWKHQFFNTQPSLWFNHLILCHPLLLQPSIFPSVRFFSNVSALHIRWPKYWSFSFTIRPSNEYSGLISFRMDWLNLFAVQGTLKSLLQ